MAGIQLSTLVDRRASLTQAGADTERPVIADISVPGMYLKVPAHEALVPQQGEDYLVAIWFLLRKLPAEGQKLILLSQYSGAEEGSGYAIGLSRQTGAMRPIVYWGTNSQHGRWYDFAELAIPPRTWALLALSFHGGRFLGVHGAITDRASGKLLEPVLLGGYDVGEYENLKLRSVATIAPRSVSTIAPRSVSAIAPRSVSAIAPQYDLIAGAFGDRNFRGVIGPLLVFSEANLGTHLVKMLREIVRHPVKKPDRLGQDGVKLFIVHEGQDVSPYNHPMQLLGARRGSSARAGE